MSLAMLAGVLPAKKEPTEPLTLGRFIEARYDELEAAARCICHEWGGGCGGGWCPAYCPTCSGGDYAPRNDAQLAQIDDLTAKRAILDMHTPDRLADEWTRTVDNACTSYGYGDHTIVYENECGTLQILAWPFRAHPDYDPAWAKYLPGALTGEFDE